MEQIRERHEAWREERERELYRVHSGRKREAALDEIDDRFADLTSGDLLGPLRAELEAQNTEAARDPRRRLIRLVESARLDAQGWRRGRELHGATRADALGELLAELFVRSSEARQKLGYASGLERFAALYERVDLDAWARGADRLLEATESVYLDRLAPALERAGVARDAATPLTLAALTERSACDSLFAGEQLLDCLEFTTAGMGVELGLVRGVALDHEPRPGRAPEARTFVLRVPGEIVVSGGERDGVRAHRDWFRAAGLAFASAYVSPELPVERRRGLDPALALGWGWLLADLLADSRWIREGPAQQRASAFAEEAALWRLLELRRAAGQLRFELELARVPAGRDPHGLAERYADELGAATGVPHTPAGYLADSDPELASLHRLRARSFALQLAEWLRERHGRAFWKERRAGELLKELWNTGSTYCAEEIAAEIGFAPLEVEPLIESCLRSS